nr:transcription factor GTE4-like isoform X1 [Coffea arabica]XP_027061597.1 transcription factor GTE4-like isoform X1 [Coffea arabica]XP_027061598.1 transcription factor GTE4-like isoform X1 [Coffea arabica]XP_027061599.1 transcription factor GTE4-like isoform X1 [Coffea arabica]
MASGTTVGGGDGEKEGSKEKQRWAEESKVYKRKSVKGLKDSSDKNNSYGAQLGQSQTGKLGSEDGNLLEEPVFGVASGDSSSRPLGDREVSGRNGVGKGGFLRQENKVTINLAMKSKREARELRKRLESELDEIRRLVKKIEGQEGKKSSKAGRGVDNGGKLKRVHSEVDSVGTPRISKPLHQLSVSVVENSNDNGDKEKRTPKANKFYKNTDFLLAKDKFPSAEGNKKSKSGAGKKAGGGESGHGFVSGKFSNQMLKNCSSLLDRLMKHKHGWVFNKPVDTVHLGLHDYFDIIKNPMDLGTVKARLSNNGYKSPKEFAEDVRLTFQNAMTYNPKGQDVHVMAEELLKNFQDKWAAIEAEYMHEMMHGPDSEVGLPTPKSKKAPPAVMEPPEMRTLSRSKFISNPVDPKTKTMISAGSGRTAAPKKPKAKEPNKREMTYDEKQKLSTNLQSLPSEKLENVVQIIKKRNPSLCQNEDEIEVDIDSVDTETLWELDRFVTNFKKSLSKNKRKAELANQGKGEAARSVPEKDLAPAAAETLKERKMEAKKNYSSQTEVEKKRDNASRSTNSSGSNADSGSSSGDSDSGSASDGSDA